MLVAGLGGPVSAQDKVILDVVSLRPGSTEDAFHAFDAQVTQFEEANPDIDIVAHEYDWTGPTFAAMLAGDTLPDVFTIPFTDGKSLIEQGQLADITELVKALLFSLFEGGLRHGLFHGDLHAGNLYVDPDGKIVFFDFGIMGRIDPRTRWLLRELVYALLVKKDHAAAGKIVVLMGAVGTVKPEAEAAKDLEKFATPLTMQNLGDMSYAEIGKQLSTLADAYDVKLPRELVLIGKQFLYVERYMKLLAPKWQMMSDPQLTGYFANFMVEVSREHDEELDV